MCLEWLAAPRRRDSAETREERIVNNETDPVVGQWYQIPGDDQEFQIVAIDEENGIIASQHFDGDLEEILLDDWYQMDAELIAAPEDWTGPVDTIELDEYDYGDESAQSEQWEDSIVEQEASSDGGWRMEEPDEADGWDNTLSTELQD